MDPSRGFLEPLRGDDDSARHGNEPRFVHEQHRVADLAQLWRGLAARALKPEAQLPDQNRM